MHNRLIFSALVALSCTATTLHATPDPQSRAADAPPPYGVTFTCSPSQLARVRVEVPRYLNQLGVSESQVRADIDDVRGTATFGLLGSESATNTLFLAQRPDLDIQDETVVLPGLGKKVNKLKTVSKKEILLALLHPGRLTRFEGPACEVQALIDHVGVRQNIVSWAEVLQWGWPEGGPAKWNTRYWHKGTPKPGAVLHAALTDMFVQQKKYEIGCYTATKMVYAHAVLDYYRRVKGDAATAKKVEQRLLQDGEPLVGLEPRKMWSFEADFDSLEINDAGKLLKMQDGVATGNFVPGDWVYFLNTDARTYQKTGYEGSNAVYLGRNKFDDYYNDNHHSYTYQEKLGEVFQWRNDVFSRTRDFAKIQPLSVEDYERLGRTPENGGFLLSYRVAPFLFGFEDLPALPAP